MADKGKIIVKIISLFIVALIFYFLGQNLYLNWGQIKEYRFSLNYFYLSLSFVFLAISFLGRGLVWKKIVDFLEPDNNLSRLEAVKFDIYSQLGKYLPGKVFVVLGKVYLARDKNISRENLYLSAVLDAIFHAAAAFVLSLFLISFFFDYNLALSNYYFIGLTVIFGVMTITQPRILRWMAGLFLRFKKREINLDFNLSWLQQFKVIFYYSLAEFSGGLGFFCLVNSLTFLSVQNLLGLIGVYVLAGVLGLVAFFAPSGLGIREGALVLLLGAYFPFSVTVLISLIARVWTTLAEVFLAGAFYIFDRSKKIN